MATAEQIKALIRSHFGDDSERFYTVALQVAAHEASQNHGALAHEIRDLVDKARQAARPKIIQLPLEMSGLVTAEEPTTPRSALVMPAVLQARIERIILEQRQQHRLKAHGLSPRRKLLLVGPPGTGKTMTARVLAHELQLPLHTVQVDRLVTKFMGETSAKLRQVFDVAREQVGVYLFDEFDAIGAERSLDNDVGEIRRVLNAFLQFIEQDASDSLIVAATNNPGLLDRALFRRFDDVLRFERPGRDDRARLMRNVLGTFRTSRSVSAAVVNASDGLSHADITQACMDAVKQAILSDESTVGASLLGSMLKERQSTE